MYSILSLSACLLAVLWSNVTFGQAVPFIYPGIQTSVEAGFSQTNTRGASSVLYNPANIIVTQVAKKAKKTKKRSSSSLMGVEVYGDFSILIVDYQYTKPNSDPAKVAMTAPPVSMGASWRPNQKFALGLMFIPRPGSERKIDNLTTESGGQPIKVNAIQNGGSAIFGLGAAVQFNPRFTLGIGINETAEKNFTSATLIGDESGVPLLQEATNGSFVQFLIGTRYRTEGGVILGASFRSSVVKKYAGSFSTKGSDPTPTTKKDHLPAIVALGFERLLDTTIVFGEYRRELWSAGASNFNAGTPGGPESKDYKDTNILIGGGRYQWGKGHAAGLALGYFPNNVGFGSAIDAESGQPIDGGLPKAGVTFGDFGALDRFVFASSYRRNFVKGYVHGGLNFQNGSRSVSSSYSGAGEYKLSVITLAVGGSRFF